MSVVVFGSINMDLVARASRLPTPGETVAGSSFATAPGGKGANQAVAAARMGAACRMVGRVGDDGLGGELRAALGAAGVDLAGVLTSPGPSGVALITLDDAGMNSIVVVPGANGLVGPDDLPRLDAALDQARALLLQLEVPLAAVVEAARLAQARGVLTILDPAPARDLPDELYAAVDLITPNEHEAAALTGIATATAEGAAAAALALGARCGAALVKCGGRGVYWSDGRDLRHWPAISVPVVDSVAAGDAFNGALAAAIGAGLAWDQAVARAVAAGALAVTRPGAQGAMPTLAEVLALLEEQRHR